MGYVLALLEVQRYGEAMTLCATYLESVAHALGTTNPIAPEESSAGAAAKEKKEAADPFLDLIHPQQLRCVVGQLPGLSPASTTGFTLLLDSPNPQLLYADQAVELIRAALPLAEAALVERVLWKCTVGYVVYDFLRTHSYRRRDGAPIVGLGMAFYEGETIHGLSVPDLVALLHGMIAEARDRSHATGRLPEPV